MRLKGRTGRWRWKAPWCVLRTRGDLNICPVTNLESRQSKDALLWSYVFGWDEFGGVVAVVS
jgi:hypothetical protein